MKKILLMVILASLMAFSCDKSSDKSKAVADSETVLTKSGDDYTEAYANRSSEISSPFELQNVSVSDDNVEITVAYSGGCKKHNFEIIWDENINFGNPPVINLIVIHHANGDACEAYIKEDLKFNVSDLMDNISTEEFSMDVSSGYSPDDSVVYSGDEYDFGFQESDACDTIVEAKRAICGVGLYQNLWFSLGDNINTGIEGYTFNKFLQPVDIDSSLSSFVPVEGEKYRIGGRIIKDHNYDDVPVCLAYPGPSIPIKITCIQHIEQ
jgi:hypothetical protein